MFDPLVDMMMSPVVIFERSIPALTTHSTVIIILSPNNNLRRSVSRPNPGMRSEKSFFASIIFDIVSVAVVSLLVA